MATNNIKIFDQNKANMLTDEAYDTSTQRLNGVQQGIASSQLQNKTLYQVSLVAYAIGQMMQANGLNANDADAVSTFAGNLSSTIVQKILDKADTTEAKNFTANDKFITPQTWKAAYDFMKADSNMVTSAVDDTHYITPKLLKEGAEKYGVNVELESGKIAKWRTFNKILESKAMANYSIVPTYILIDKLKRYFIYALVDSYGNISSLLLFDYTTKELLDSLIASIGIISNLSENMFVCSYGSALHAIDFSTGKFIEKNSYSFESSYDIVVDLLKNYFSYFTADIYVPCSNIYSQFSSNSYIIKYSIATNTFSKVTMSDYLINRNSSFAIDEEGNAYILLVSSDTIFIFSSKDNFATHETSITSSSSIISFQSKNGFIYIVRSISSSNYELGKFSVSTYEYAKLFDNIYISNYDFYNLLVNFEETAFYLNGTKYGTGEMVPDINDNVVYALGSGTISGSNNAILVAKGSTETTKYQNDIVTSNYRIVVDPEYAYFGAPVTEIPEST